jgi:4-hydroxy-tetrahydrodipicolinate synthase
MKAQSLIWSATPTPLTDEFRVDAPSVERLMAHHTAYGIDGVFLGGSCGEGPWMRWEDQEDLVRIAAASNPGRLSIAAQVTDNSALRILDHAERFARCGADFVVLAGPTFVMNPTPERILKVYTDVLRNSPLPVIVYDRGKADRYLLPNELLRELYHEPGIAMIKDSSCDDSRMEVAIEARRNREGLTLLNGDEFQCLKYLSAGYDGLLLGGAIFNGRLARRMDAAFHAGNRDEAEILQPRMIELMSRVYGGRDARCWMAGLKYLLHQAGIFSSAHSLLDYELSDSCRQAIDEILVGADIDNFRPDIWSDTCLP